MKKLVLAFIALGLGAAFLPSQSASAVNIQRTVAECSSVESLVTTDLSSWDLSQTRTKGHNVIIDNGLRVYTDSNDSQSKAAAYYGTNFALSAAGTNIDLDWTGTSPEPGLQLVVDFDNNGTIDGILVGEAGFYGANWWGSNQVVGFQAANPVPVLPTTPGGGGVINGTLNQYLAAYPNTQVKAIGYSLGSGILGDGVINSLTIGCVRYTFDLPAPVEPTVPGQVLGASDAAAPVKSLPYTSGNSANLALLIVSAIGVIAALIGIAIRTTAKFRS